MSLQASVRRLILRRYLLHRSSITPSDLKRGTQSLMASLIDQLRILSDEQLDAARPGAWNVREILYHSFKAALFMVGTSERLRNGQTAMDVQHHDIGRTLRQSRHELGELANKAAQRFSEIDVTRAARTDACAAHPWFGPLNSYQWLVLNYVHLQRHARQIDRNLGRS